MNFSFNNSHLPNISDKNAAIPAFSGTERFNSVLAYLTVLCAIPAFVFNAILLIAFYRRPQLRTPFSVYIINLAVTEIILSIIPIPLNFVRILYGYYPHNALTCSLLTYVAILCNAGIRIGHVLVTVNRLWAVTFPVGYKMYHTKTVAVALVLTGWLVEHALNVPAIVLGRIGKQSVLLTADPQCRLDSTRYRDFQVAIQLIVFAVPELFIILVYPFVIWRLRKVKKSNVLTKTKVNQVVPAGTSGQDSDKKPSLRSRGRGNSESLVVSGNENSPGGRAGNQVRDKQVAGMVGVSGSSRIRAHNRIFTYLVVAMILCWTPNSVYFVMAQLINYYNATFYAVQNFALYVNSWLNPLLVYFADARIRGSVNDLLRWC